MVAAVTTGMLGESWLSAVRRDDVCVGGGAALGNSHPPLLFPLAVFHPPSGIRGFSPLGFFDRMARDGDGFRRSGGFSGLGVPQWVGGGGLHVLPLGSLSFFALSSASTPYGYAVRSGDWSSASTSLSWPASERPLSHSSPLPCRWFWGLGG